MKTNKKETTYDFEDWEQYEINKIHAIEDFEELKIQIALIRSTFSKVYELMSRLSDFDKWIF